MHKRTRRGVLYRCFNCRRCDRRPCSKASALQDALALGELLFDGNLLLAAQARSRDAHLSILPLFPTV